MTPRQIKPEDVRVGDRVRWECKGLVIEGEIGWTNGCGFSFARLPNSICGDGALTLLDRPLPPIQAEVGTLIRPRSALFAGAVVWAASCGRWRDSRGLLPEAFAPTRENYDVLVPEQDPS